MIEEIESIEFNDFTEEEIEELKKKKAEFDKKIRQANKKKVPLGCKRCHRGDR